MQQAIVNEQGGKVAINNGQWSMANKQSVKPKLQAGKLIGKSYQSYTS
jgi:hypothetical protein